MLQTKLKNVGFTKDATGAVTYVSIQDNTGNYDVSTNPTGWGAPNVVRADTFLYVFAYQLGLPASKTPLVLQTGYDGLDSATIAKFAISGDGIYQFAAFPLSIIEPSGTFPVGTVWYDVTSQQVRKIIVANDATQYAVIQNSDDLLDTLVSGNVDLYDFSICNALIKRGRLWYHLEEQCEGTPAYKQAQKAHKFLWFQIEGIYHNYAFGNYFKMVKNLDAVTSCDTSFCHC